MHRKTTENAVFTRNFEFIDPLRSFDRNMVFNYTNLTIRKGLTNKAELEKSLDEYYAQYREPNGKFSSLCSFKHKN